MTRLSKHAASDVMPTAFFRDQRVPLLISCVVGLLLALHFVRPPAGGLWTQVLLNSLHVPVFGLIAVFIFLTGGSASTLGRRAVTALIATAVLGTLSEAAQIFTSRDASWRDLVADCIGAISFLAIFLALRPANKFSGIQRTMLLGVAVLLLGWVLAPLATTGAAYIERISQFPTIVRFDSRFGRLLARAQNIDYQIVSSTQGEPAHALITLRDKPWPGVAFHDVWPDWSGFSTLIIELGVNGDSPLPINIRAHDEPHKSSKKFTDRFNRSFTLDPGRQSLRIPLTDLVNAPHGRLMDLTEMSELIIFSDASNAGRSFKLYDIRLE